MIFSRVFHGFSWEMDDFLHYEPVDFVVNMCPDDPIDPGHGK
jgi:hypothetical protein